jgi:predicted RNase H-like nuclease (RuvC/YqgF family)
MMISIVAADSSTATQVLAAVLGAGGMLTGAASLWRARAENRSDSDKASADDRRVGIEQVKMALAAQDALIARLTDRNAALSAQVAECVADRAVLHQELDELRSRLQAIERKGSG